MYTISQDTEVSAKLFKEMIKKNDEEKSRLDKLENYYKSKHDILSRYKSSGLSNNKVVVNHARYITETCVGYLLGSPVEYQVNNEKYDITAVLDVYKKQVMNDFDISIAKANSIYGKQFEYIYTNADIEPRSCSMDVRNCIIAYDDTVEHKKVFGIIYSKEKDNEYKIIYADDSNVIEYYIDGNNLREESKKPHKFGEVPIIEYKNNEEETGDFEPVLSLIDAYNVLQSDRVNDKEQLVDAILCLYGVDFTVEQAEQLREARMISNLPSDSKVEYLIKTLQESDTDILRRNIENDIHKIAMVPNMADENFASNASGVAIKYKLLSFEQNIKNKERYMERGLMERFRLYNNFLSTTHKMQLVPTEEVDAVFKRNLPSNDYETSQMINNLSDFVDKETLIAQLSFIQNAKDIVETKEREKEKENTGRERVYQNIEIPKKEAINEQAV